jgi:hypothetical protein
MNTITKVTSGFKQLGEDDKLVQSHKYYNILTQDLKIPYDVVYDAIRSGSCSIGYTHDMNTAKYCFKNGKGKIVWVNGVINIDGLWLESPECINGLLCFGDMKFTHVKKLLYREKKFSYVKGRNFNYYTTTLL